jgi:predicted  nucleic acid-binding Zn-ribbon protein
MNKEQMDLQMISYLQSKVTKVTKRITDLEGTISTFKDSEKVSTLPDVVTSQAVPNIPHWESELVFLNYKLEWLESQIYYFGEDARQKESLQRSIEFLKQRGEY